MLQTSCTPTIGAIIRWWHAGIDPRFARAGLEKPRDWPGPGGPGSFSM